MLEDILNIEPTLELNWHLDYGIRGRRVRTLLAPFPERNSFLHPGSETALSLFMFGNMDCWKQLGITDKPRNECEHWNAEFFDNLRNEKSTVVLQQPLWPNLKIGPFQDQSLDWQKSILMFEFEVLNTGFHSIDGQAFRDLSFLDIRRNRRWGAFDAFIVVPSKEPTQDRKGFLIGLESKLGSDISRNTMDFVFVNQIMRNLEAGYWLTHHKASLYQNWEFHYVFACPRLEFEFGAMLYSWILRDNDARNLAVSQYAAILKHHGASVNAKDFQAFREMALSRVAVVFWDQIAEVLLKMRTDFWSNYIKRLQQVQNSKEVVRATISRLKTAGIEVT